MIKRHDSSARLSKAVTANGFVFLSGLVARDPGLDVRGQTLDILEQIDELLARTGTDKTRLVSVNIWMKDIAQFAEMNGAWESWVAPGAPPARATVQSQLANDKLLVEIMAQAVL